MRDCKQHNRGELRYKIGAESRVTLLSEPTERGAHPFVVTARLLDLSPQGARLAIPVLLPAHTNCVLNIALPEIATHVDAEALICWSKRCESEEYIVGCRLSPTIPEDIFRRLVAGEQLDRCELHDYEERGRFQFIHHLDETTAPIWGSLRNYSRGGFSFYTAASQAMSPGDRIQVVLGAPEVIMLVAVVCWKIELGSESGRLRHLRQSGMIRRTRFSPLTAEQPG